MFFNYWKKHNDLERRHQTEKLQMLAAGMSEEAIADVFRLDWQQFYHDAKFYGQLDVCISPNAKSLENIQDFSTGIMDELDNVQLHAALSKLRPHERELVILHVADGISLKLISALWGKKYEGLRKEHQRAAEKLKK